MIAGAALPKVAALFELMGGVMSVFRVLIAFFLIIPTFLTAQGSSRTILVLDGSGSMWGQIDGTAKIEIAQGVIGELLATLPEDQELGLAAYGHRTEGDCTDIETMVYPGPGTRADISAAVGAIKPRGKTPMTDAVIIAAEALQYTQQKATVILVSDGIETCNPDPCAAARTLEETGVDFTAHVVGFDVTDPEALAQMQCLADETGGRFLTADNASELGEALVEVAAAPEPVAVTVDFVATEGEGGPRIDTPLIWNLVQGATDILDFERGATVSAVLLPGEYTVSVLRPEDEASAEMTFAAGETAQTVTLVLPSMLPDASLDAPDTAVAGSTIQVGWTGPNAQNDYVAVSKPDDPRYENYTYTRKGTPLDLLMPPVPGTYELRYFLNKGGKVLAAKTIEVTEVTATLEADAEVPAGATLPVTWEGPDYQNDYISVARIGDARYGNYAYTRKGSPAEVLMPTVPGTYELRYVMNQDNTVLATRPIVVTEITAALSAPAQAAAGQPVEITWEGPDYQNDYISVARPGDKRYEGYTYTRRGNPLEVVMPLVPGSYELRYVMNQDNTILAAQPIEVVDVQATLDIPETARAGAGIVVNWNGPGYDNDYISIARPGDPKYDAYTYTRNGNPLIVTTPPVPGTYEIRYVASSNGTSILARKEIILTEVTATLQANGTGPSGGNLAVEWEGPDFKGDYISIARAQSSDSEHESYKYTSEDSPVILKLPEQPGEYELRYVIAQDRIVIARQTLVVE